MSKKEKQIKFRSDERTDQRFRWALYCLDISQQEAVQKALDAWFEKVEKEFGAPAERPRAATRSKLA